MEREQGRQMPIGTEVIPGGVAFRVWAPKCRRLNAVLDDREIPLTAESEGYFSGFADGAKPGQRYGFRLNGSEHVYPDPVSRYQPDGPHGLSQIVDPAGFSWTDKEWKGVKRSGQIVYEMHIGTFTPEGTWAAAMERLPYLADVGITLIEMMPVADFAGDFGWGYDGVNMFAPCRLYGTPDDLRRFIDRAHSLGLGVILDVVYNHFGPDGNYLGLFSPHYVTSRHKTDWGEAINYDAEHSAPVREFVCNNAAYWIREFHFDGLRLDATQDIFDDSPRHILVELGEAARAAAGDRSIYLVGENEPQHARLVHPIARGGYGLDALWNDDFHHTAMVALSGRSEAYYSDYRGTPQEFVSSIKWGFLFQGQNYVWQKKRRGMPALHLEPDRFVTFLQNHDQIANSGLGVRSHQFAHPGQHRALTALMLLGPGTPMLFQGQEFAATTRFYYFASHKPEIAAMVRDGRKNFLAQFPSLASKDIQDILPDPTARETFEVSKLDWTDVKKNEFAVAMHRDLIALRKGDPVLSRQSANIDGAVLHAEAFVLRFFSQEECSRDRLLIINLGSDLDLSPAPEPLLADPEGCEWKVAWCSEDPKYGGLGVPPVAKEGCWFLPGRSATYFVAEVPSPALMKTTAESGTEK